MTATTPPWCSAPTWSIVHSKIWKAQVPYLARHFRVVTLDGRGNGRSGRPVGAAAYVDDEYADDIVAVMDATDTDCATLVGLSMGALWSVHRRGPPPRTGHRAPRHRARHRPRGAEPATRPHAAGLAELDAPEGWAKFNRAHWLGGGHDDFLRFFFSEMFVEPHSTKQIEDCVGWGRETDPATLVATIEAGGACSSRTAAEIEARLPPGPLPGPGDPRQRRPHPPPCRGRTARRGHRRLAPHDRGRRPRCPGAGSGAHQPAHQGLRRPHRGRPRRRARSTWTRARNRPKRALYISSPIGLGHARRDLAIANELRQHHPDLQIDWLAQPPVTTMLDAAGERVHPGSAWLASESAHIDDECAEHDLHAFQAIRRMDEILVNNFMVFHDIVDADHYDLVIGDEAWDVDYFLHENPELKRFAFAWMTDFVGWLPMPDGGHAEAALTADYNAEMIEQRARYRRLRDRSIFVGEPDDIVPDTFGPDLPAIRDWTEQEFDFSGYITGFDPAELGDRDGAASRARLPRRRAGVHRHRRRNRRRRGAAAPRSSRRCPPCDGPSPTCASRSWPARASTRRRCPTPTARRSTASSRNSTGTSPSATSRSCRAGSPPAWSSPPTDDRSSTSRSATTSSRTSTSATDWPTTAPGAACPTTSSP